MGAITFSIWVMVFILDFLKISRRAFWDKTRRVCHSLGYSFRLAQSSLTFLLLSDENSLFCPPQLVTRDEFCLTLEAAAIMNPNSVLRLASQRNCNELRLCYNLDRRGLQPLRIMMQQNLIERLQACIVCSLVPMAAAGINPRSIIDCHEMHV